MSHAAAAVAALSRHLLLADADGSTGRSGGGDEPPPDPDAGASAADITAGVLLAAGGTFCAALANILVKWTHERESAKQKAEQTACYKRPVWYLIFTLYIVGGLVDFAAYGLAPLSLLAPVASVTIVMNAVLAHAVFGEKLTVRDGVGSVVIIAGAATATAVGSRASADADLDQLLVLWRQDVWLAFMSCELVLMALAYVLVTVWDPMWPGTHVYCRAWRRARCNACPRQCCVDPRDRGPMSPNIGSGKSLVVADQQQLQQQQAATRGPRDSGPSPHATLALPPPTLSSSSSGGAFDEVKTPPPPVAAVSAEAVVVAAASPHSSSAGASDAASPVSADTLSPTSPAAGALAGPPDLSRSGSSGDDMPGDGFVVVSSSSLSASSTSLSSGSARAGSSVLSSGRSARDSVLSGTLTPNEAVGFMGQSAVATEGRAQAIHRTRAVMYAFLTSSAGAWTNILGKCCSELMRETVNGSNQWSRFESWMMLLALPFFAVAQLRFMSEMMAIFEAVLIVPIYQCVFMVWLIVCGQVFFQEFSSMAPLNIGVFCTGVVVCGVGVFILTRRPPPTAEEVADARAKMAAAAAARKAKKEAKAAAKALKAKQKAAAAAAAAQNAADMPGSDARFLSVNSSNGGGASAPVVVSAPSHGTSGSSSSSAGAAVAAPEESRLLGAAGAAAASDAATASTSTPPLRGLDGSNGVPASFTPLSGGVLSGGGVSLAPPDTPKRGTGAVNGGHDAAHNAV